MLLDEHYDADEILKEPTEIEDELFSEEEDTVSELQFGGSHSLNEIDIPPEEESDLYS